MRLNRYFIALVCLLIAVALLTQTPAAAPKLSVLIISGVNNHNWKATTPVLRQYLEDTGKFDVRVNEEPRGITADTLKPYDVVLLNWNDYKKTQGQWWGEAGQQAFLDYTKSGKGVVIFHAANNAFWGWPEFDKLVGGTWRETAGHGPIHTYKVENKAPGHPIMEGIRPFEVTDELYHKLSMQPGIELLAAAYDDPKNCWKPNEGCGTGQVEPLIWTVKYGSGRVFQTALGHDVKAMQAPGFIATLQRGTEWAATGKVTIPVPASLKQP